MNDNVYSMIMLQSMQFYLSGVSLEIHGIQCNAVWLGRRAGKLNENDEDVE
jgi:hypothetical protein